MIARWVQNDGTKRLVLNVLDGFYCLSKINRNLFRHNENGFKKISWKTLAVYRRSFWWNLSLWFSSKDCKLALFSGTEPIIEMLGQRLPCFMKVVEKLFRRLIHLKGTELLCSMILANDVLFPLSLFLDSLWPWLSTLKVCSRRNRTWKPVLPVSLSCTVNTLNRAGTKAQSHLSSSLTEEQPKHGICMFRLQLLLSTWTNGFSWIEAMEQQVVDGLWNSLNKSCKHATVVIFYGFYRDSTLDTQESLWYIIELKDTNLYVVDLDGFGKTFSFQENKPDIQGFQQKWRQAKLELVAARGRVDPCQVGCQPPFSLCLPDAGGGSALEGGEVQSHQSRRVGKWKRLRESSMAWVVVVPASQDSSSKWRLIGLAWDPLVKKKCILYIIILVVTVTGQKNNPKYSW